ncbi:MAG: hypothetical protein CM1200mP2_13130 [Planctomycetaceae bacterium]|nr:MAG: hypothetical protein CM1200mP2_13130 [Planctomycetaceae bacterium]
MPTGHPSSLPACRRAWPPGTAGQATGRKRLSGDRPTLISRDSEFSGDPRVRYTNQPHREFIYRMAFELGRHVIGYEVQKVQAAIDALGPIARRRCRWE